MGGAVLWLVRSQTLPLANFASYRFPYGDRCRCARARRVEDMKRMRLMEKLEIVGQGSVLMHGLRAHA